MGNDSNITLVNIRAVKTLLKKKNFQQALIEMDKMDPSCDICTEYVGEGKDIIQDAIEQCSLEKNEECEALTNSVISLFNDLEEGYSMIGT